MGDIPTAYDEAFSTFGAKSTWRGLRIIDSPRFRDLDRKQAYYACTQHDYKRFDFDGRVIQAGGGIGVTQPLISAAKAPFYVPLRSRRPSSPYRLGRVIVQSFTNLLFGENRFPVPRVLGDYASQDYVGALVKATSLPVRMIHARNIGGSSGTGALSWRYVDGLPRVEVHNPKHLFVHSWDDRDELIPRHVTEAYLYGVDEWSGEKRQIIKNYYWYRRDWLPNVDIVFKPLLFEKDHDPCDYWEPDLTKSVVHNDGLTHFAWIQNLPTEEIDGSPDYEGLYENFDTLDLILSVIMRGAILNLDPTLVLKMDRELVNRMGVRKGSDNALAVGENGDASYLELAGQSIDSGIKLFNENRKYVLEVARCVILDPDKAAAAGISSVAQKMTYQPMLGQGDILREQYGTGMKRILEPMLVVAQKTSKSTITIFDDETQQPKEIQPVILLPDLVETDPILDDDGVPTGENSVTSTPRDPGAGTDVDLEWGPWFPPTAADQTALITSLTTAAGQGVQVLSQQTSTELAAAAFGRDPNEEWVRVQKGAAAAEQKQADMFPPTGGGAAPPGASDSKSGSEEPESSSTPPGGAPPSGSASEDPNAPKPPSKTVTHTAPTGAGGTMTTTIGPPPPSISSSTSDSDEDDESDSKDSSSKPKGLK